MEQRAFIDASCADPEASRPVQGAADTFSLACSWEAAPKAGRYNRYAYLNTRQDACLPSVSACERALAICIQRSRCNECAVYQIKYISACRGGSTRSEPGETVVTPPKQRRADGRACNPFRGITRKIEGLQRPKKHVVYLGLESANARLFAGSIAKFA